MAGKGAKSKANKRKAQAKQADKKAARQRDNFIASLPPVSEDDLLAFQLKHFGDDSHPDHWFVDAETAMNCTVEGDEDGLGYYDDGTKRTLTDEQIAIFRRTELWQIKRAQMEQDEAGEAGPVEERACSPASEASSLEDELLPHAVVAPQKRHQSPDGQTHRRPSQNNRSSTADSTDSWKHRRSEQIVPYNQRHKRKWESYVQDVDPVEGSLTHRRIARELDNQQHESIEMEY